MKKIILTSLLLLFIAIAVESQVRIKMKKEGGVYTTPCIVNGLRLRFIFDTGASNVSMSLSEAIFMLKNGYLEEDDLHGSSYSQIANGDVVENTTVNLKEIEIGGIKIYDVKAIIIHELSAPLLLGQSAIQKLGKIQIEDDILIIINADGFSSENACAEAKKMVDKARQNYFDELYNLSADTYQKAYDLCSEAVDCYDLRLMGTAYYSSDNYSYAIKYLEKAANCERNNKILSFILLDLGNAYYEFGDYENAILNIQKSLSYTEENERISICYIYLGYIYSERKNYIKAIEFYEKSVEFSLKYLKKDVNDVMRGKIKDDLLGETYNNISNTYYKLNQVTKGDKSMIKSALCGYETAINLCNKYGLNYELYLE